LRHWIFERHCLDNFAGLQKKKLNLYFLYPVFLRTLLLSAIANFVRGEKNKKEIISSLCLCSHGVVERHCHDRWEMKIRDKIESSLLFFYIFASYS